MNKKPDALLILAIVFGLGVLISTLTHSTDQSDQAANLAVSAGVSAPQVSQ